METSKVEFARFLQISFGYDDINDIPGDSALYERLYQVIPKEYLEETPSVILWGNPIRQIKELLTEEQLQKLYEAIPQEVIKSQELQKLFSIHIENIRYKVISFSFLYNPIEAHLCAYNSHKAEKEKKITLKTGVLEKDLKRLSSPNKSRCYLFHFAIDGGKAGNGNHNELFLVSSGKTCIPIYYKNNAIYFPSSHYKVLRPSYDLAPMYSKAKECNLSNILYAKSLLKNDSQYLKESIFFEKYNNKGEIERFFVPHPEVLKYSYSNQYNKYMLSLTSDGRYSHKANGAQTEKEFKNPSIKEILLESIKNIESLKTSNSGAFTEEMKKILEDNKALLEDLPSIDEKFRQHYETKVLPWREKTKVEKKGRVFYDSLKFKRRTTCKKAEEYAAYLLKNNEESKNIYVKSEINEDIAEAVLATTLPAVEGVDAAGQQESLPEFHEKPSSIVNNIEAIIGNNPERGKST